jgi:hypothetical protein
MKEIVTATGAPFKLICCELRLMVYPEIVGAVSVRFTVLGVELKGVIVTCPEAPCPPTGCKVRTLAGEKVKSGTTTLTEELCAVLWP